MKENKKFETKGKNIIFSMDGKSGKKTKDNHYAKWNGEKFTRCKKSEIEIAKYFGF